MTISSALNAGVAGLAANASRLSTISDNIANSATYGYKRATTEFDSMVIGSSSGRYVAGGVRTTAQRLVSERGPLTSSTNATDLAIRGRGFLPVTTATAINDSNGQLPLRLATTGSFRTDDEGYLRTANGMVLMGFPASPNGTIPTFPRDTSVGLQPIQINANQISGAPTTRVNLAANLPATSTEFGSAVGNEVLSVEYFDNLGKSENLGVTFTPTVPGAAGASNEWTLTITDSSSGGAVVGEYTLTFDDSRTTGGTLLSVATVSGPAYVPGTGIIPLMVAGGPIDFNIGLYGANDGMTQLSDRFVPSSISKDGSPAGNMTSVEVDENGYVVALFDTGISRRIYQIPLGRRAQSQRPSDPRPADLLGHAGKRVVLPVGCRRRADRRRRRLRARGIGDRRGAGTHLADPDPAGLCVQCQGDPDGRRDVAGNDEHQALRLRP